MRLSVSSSYSFLKCLYSSFVASSILCSFNCIYTSQRCSRWKLSRFDLVEYAKQASWGNIQTRWRVEQGWFWWCVVQHLNPKCRPTLSLGAKRNFDCIFCFLLVKSVRWWGRSWRIGSALALYVHMINRPLACRWGDLTVGANCATSITTSCSTLPLHRSNLTPQRIRIKCRTSHQWLFNTIAQPNLAHLKVPNSVH